MKTAKVEYLGLLRTRAIHLRSGAEFFTDAPLDNHGKGEAFSPTDLASTSLASCMLTVMGLAAQTHSIKIDGAYADVLKVMKENPRRISQIEIDIYMPKFEYTSKEKSILEHTANTCPVSKSLHPDLEVILRFHW
ncbi:MAG: OsmC family protein [Saprospiraceae bacterium]